MTSSFEYDCHSYRVITPVIARGEIPIVEIDFDLFMKIFREDLEFALFEW